MASRDELLKQIRILGKGTRGAPPVILDLADDTLYEVFEQLRRGLSCRAVARYLRSSGMKGSENSLQQTLSLLRQRIAPLLAEPATSSLPKTPVKLPANFSSLPTDEALSTITDIMRFYGQAIRQATQAAAEKGKPLSEDLTKHVKAYDILVARKTRMEEKGMKDRPVEPRREDPEDFRRFDALANTVYDFLFADGDGDKMVAASKRFLALIAQKCILLEKDPTTGKLCEVTGPPTRNRTYNQERIPNQ